MDFASQAHRDKLNFELRLKLFTTRCSSPLGNCFTQTNPKSHYGSRCEPGTGEFPWIGVLRGVMLQTLIVLSAGSQFRGWKSSDPSADFE